MIIPTEPIGSIPRSAEVIRAWGERQAGRVSAERFQQILDEALMETIRRFEETGSPVISDGEQTKSSFATYPLDGASDLAPDGVVVPFKDGHTRQLPRLTKGPFRYSTHASKYVAAAKALTRLPVKQAVISASALSLLYPQAGIPGYSRETFLSDLVGEAVTTSVSASSRVRTACRSISRRSSLAQARSHRRPSRAVRRAEQPRPRTFLRCRATADRSSHMSGRRSRLDAQR